ncbi:hypothetical protein SAMN05443575_1132 [Jatrophihabitans endophyticus]|uniref:Uncharacterized protein n=1 Tax=Jatrophihabitans endophyticus TaxID=1206085 RepID=A0A1M5GCU7_9ACTN|nr:hypothetical protein [Jatrophihabitans endophyticus]SHG01516.1 hypothetical protein SAMN05443575_1132 [Jatrophihabitans endophyticus]
MSVAPGPSDQAAYPPAPTGEYGAPAAQGPKVSVTWTDALLVLGALVAAVGSFLPFEKLTYHGGSYSVTGFGSASTSGSKEIAQGYTTDLLTPGHGGVIVLVGALVVLLAGLLVLAGKGRLWVSIVSLVVSVVAGFIALVALGVPASDAKDLNNLRDDFDVSGSVQIGAVLCAIGMIVALAFSIVALCVRRRRG